MCVEEKIFKNQSRDLALSAYRRSAFIFGALGRVFSTRMPEKLYEKKLKEILWRTSLSRHKQEYAKAVFGRYSHFGSTAITRSEAEEALEDLEQNSRDLITPRDIELLRRAIENYFGE